MLYNCYRTFSRIYTIPRKMMKPKAKTIAAVWKIPTAVDIASLALQTILSVFFFSHSVADFFLCTLGFRLSFLPALANLRQSLPSFFSPNPHLQNGLLGTPEKVACLQGLQVVHISQDLVQKLARLLCFWFDSSGCFFRFRLGCFDSSSIFFFGGGGFGLGCFDCKT